MLSDTNIRAYGKKYKFAKINMGIIRTKAQAFAR